VRGFVVEALFALSKRMELLIVALDYLSEKGAIMSFADLVEEVRHRPVEEQLELQEIIEHNVISLRREEIYQNHLTSLDEIKRGALHFSSDIDVLMAQLDDESGE
jgi:hypothetical protein